jgi:hypothetical protein
MGYTIDPDDPRLGHGIDTSPVPQHDTYLVLSDEERAKGFVRPLRRSYRHVGPAGPRYALRDLTDDEKERYHTAGYVKFEAYPPGHQGSVLGRFWSQKALDDVGNGCGAPTIMDLPLCETYARDPYFYGATYCTNCQRHLPVAEFVWSEDGKRVGS